MTISLTDRPRRTAPNWNCGELSPGRAHRLIAVHRWQHALHRRLRWDIVCLRGRRVAARLDCPRSFREPISYEPMQKIISLAITLAFVVFFSSRRRHTRYIGDWSSDVCSSDLGEAQTEQVPCIHIPLSPTGE